MSNKKIRININDPKSIQAAIDEVNAYREMIKTGSEKLVDRLSKDAQQLASTEYASAEYAGDNDVQVNVTKTDPLHARVAANGYAALFIEFGTGIMKSDSPEARADLKSGNVVGHGAYGRHLGKLQNGWRYAGSMGSNPPSDTYIISSGSHRGMIQTRGNDATPALYQAKKQAQKELPELVKEVFK